MATTRIIPLHAGKGRTVGKAISDIIDYVKNPDKTDHGRLITSYQCDSRVADAQFLLDKQTYAARTGRVRGADDVIAYHLRQSFVPGEITPEEANRLGVELARRFTKGKHAFIVCTHIDKAHVHNHIIWNSTTLECDRKFRNFWGSTRAVHRLSDTICIENGYSIVEAPKRRGQSYNKWLGDAAKPSHKELLRQAIDRALAQKPTSLEELLRLLLPAEKRRDSSPQARAWIELSKQQLYQNVDALSQLLPPGCQLMPAVKANAYGHGAVLIAKALQEKGIRAFCVASVTEGVELRKNGITGKILILGYTHPDSFPLLWKYRLTQTVVDYPYAQSLNACRKKVQVHLKIDTGMHRLGIRSDHIEEISRIFQMDNLLVDGIYTHLCVSDSMTAADREFTYQQSDAFYTLLEKLSERGISCPNIHLSASYGLIHYPEFPSNYARIGIALYGMLSSRQDEENCSIPLFPVLSVKARVSSVRDLYKGEGAGYGLRYVAKENRQIAVLSIGYADGIPRSLSNGHGRVLINGQFAPIIGNICMDQMLVDVTDIKKVKQGDIAVLIGKSGDLEITAYDLAEQTESITNEILSRLGARLERILI